MEVQLELNMDNKSSAEMQLFVMQKQLDAMNDSMGKVRRKLFAEMGEMKKVYADLQRENQELKAILRDMSHEKTEWSYNENGCLFDVRESKVANG